MVAEEKGRGRKRVRWNWKIEGDDKRKKLTVEREIDGSNDDKKNGR